MLFMGNKNMESYAIIAKTANKISELKFVAWVGLKPTFLVSKKILSPLVQSLASNFPFQESSHTRQLPKQPNTENFGMNSSLCLWELGD